MNKSFSFSWHTTALAAIFVLGNAVIGLPTKKTDEFTFAAYLISALCLFGIYFLINYLSEFFIGIENSSSVYRKCIGIIFLICIAVYGAMCAAVTFKEMADFVSAVILPRTPKFFVMLIFGAAVVYFAFKRQENVLKFSLISFVFIAIVILFFFIAAMDKYDLRNIFIFRLPTFKEIGKQIKPYIINPLIPTLLLPVYFIFAFGERRISRGLGGVAIGLVLLGLCFLTSVLLFGPFLAGRLDFPYSSAVSTVTVGRLFTRLDGFSYFIYFACSLIKITVCIFITFTSLKKINYITKRKGRNF